MRRRFPLSLLLLACLGLGCGESASSGDADSGVSADLGSDAVVAKGPLAKVYENNPVDDQKTLIEVELQHLTDPDGKLVGEFVDAYNCVNKPGEKFDIDLGVGMKFSGSLCTLEKSVLPGKDGSYLHVEPPKWDGDGSDPFAELMMYHHVTTIHDYFKSGLGLTHMDRPLRAIVNLQAYVDALGRWIGLVNAAYVPKESAGIFEQFGVNILGGEDAIVFIQGEVDTAYDASVIYHEYTHAVIGSALQGAAADKYGTDPTPGALNEALADYFAASRLDTAKIGSYALGSVGAARDLNRDFRCPGHLVGEVHHDGEIAAGALWAARKQLGKDIADKAIMTAVLSYTPQTTFAEGATAILDEVKKLAPDKEPAIRQLFEERGLLGCDRLVDHQDFDNTGKATLSPGYPANSAVYADGAPAYLQYKIEIAPTTKEIEIAWTAEGNAGMPGLPGAPGEISVALRKGSEAITYTYDKTPASSSAHVVLPGQGQKVVIAGACVTAGPMVFQFLNRASSPGELKKVTVTQRDTVSGATNFDSCP